MSFSGNVGVFWDYENCRPPSGTSGYTLVENLRQVTQDLGNIIVFKAYLEMTIECMNVKAMTLHSELQTSGITLIHCPHNGRKDVADKMMIVDMLTFAFEHPTPTTIVLITGDRDFAYAVSILRLRGYPVILVVPPNVAHASLKVLAIKTFDWQDITESGNAGPTPLPFETDMMSSTSMRRPNIDDPISSAALHRGTSSSLDKHDVINPPQPATPESLTHEKGTAGCSSDVDYHAGALQFYPDCETAVLTAEAKSECVSGLNHQYRMGLEVEAVPLHPDSGLETCRSTPPCTLQGFLEITEEASRSPQPNVNPLQCDDKTNIAASSTPLIAPECSLKSLKQNAYLHEHVNTRSLDHSESPKNDASLGLSSINKIWSSVSFDHTINSSSDQPSRTDQPSLLLPELRPLSERPSLTPLPLGIAASNGTSRCTSELNKAAEKSNMPSLSLIVDDKMPSIPVGGSAGQEQPPQHAEFKPSLTSKECIADGRFDLLVEFFVERKSSGTALKVRSSELAIELKKRDPRVYEKAGVSKFKAYTEEARKARVIVSPGMDPQGNAWVELNPALYANYGSRPQSESHSTPNIHPKSSNSGTNNTQNDTQKFVFDPIIRLLRSQEASYRMLYSKLGELLRRQFPDAYTEAEVPGLSAYLVRAASAGIVRTGGHDTPGRQWVELLRR